MTSLALGLGLGQQVVSGGAAPVAGPLIQGATAGYFLDDTNVPASTTRMQFKGKLKFPTGATLTGVRPFSAVSTSIEAAIQNDGSVNITVEDGTGTAVMSNVQVAPASTVVLDSEQTWDIDVNHVTEEAIVSIGASSTTTAFTVSGNGVFQTIRRVGFLARSGGTYAVPENTEARDLEVYFNGALHKAISNDPATANADTWHQGGNFT
jgi:hypothetical protein